MLPWANLKTVKSEKINNLQKLSDLRKSLHNDHEAAMYELLEKLDIKSKKLKKFENQMCSLEELDGLRETEKSHKRLMQSHENIIKVCSWKFSSRARAPSS